MNYEAVQACWGLDACILYYFRWFSVRRWSAIRQLCLKAFITMCISCSCRIRRLRLHDFPVSFSSPREFMSGLFFIAKHKWGKKVSQSRFYSIYFLFLQYVQNTIANLMSARVLYLYCVCLLCRPVVPLIHTVWNSLISVSGVARGKSPLDLGEIKTEKKISLSGS